jgi:hypothetical protein
MFFFLNHFNLSLNLSFFQPFSILPFRRCRAVGSDGRLASNGNKFAPATAFPMPLLFLFFTESLACFAMEL